jgi:EAL domain-containing protein (putative c-di-GMP-specific phosphodiesterase class I)
MAQKRAIVGYEATPWFSGILDRPGEVERLADIAPMLRTTGLVTDVAFYLMYEAADTILRMINCKLDHACILVHVPDDFYTQGSRLKGFNQLYEDQPIEKPALKFTISEECVLQANKATLETISRYLRNDMDLVLDNFHPENWEPEKLQELGFKYLRLAPDTCMKEETEDIVRVLKTWGFTIWGGNVDSADMRKWLFDNGAECVCGPITGEQMLEDEMIRSAIVRQHQ